MLSQDDGEAESNEVGWPEAYYVDMSVAELRLFGSIRVLKLNTREERLWYPLDPSRHFLFDGRVNSGLAP